MGDTLHKVVTEISNDHNELKLWDKGQVIVLLIRTEEGKNIIFVGGKQDTINSLTSLIQSSNQWMNYMEIIMDLENDIGTPQKSQLSVFRHEECPFRLSDMALPTCNTGFVYMLVSTRDFTYTYIGMTFNIGARLSQNNSGCGSSSTEPSTLRPFALFAYVCGFEGDKNSMSKF